MAAFAAIGAALTALGFWVPSLGWGAATLAAGVVTLGAGLALRFGAHRFVAAMLLNVWFLIAITLPAAYGADGVTSHTWAQALAWLAGCTLWIALAGIQWLARGRKDRTAPVPEIPGDTSRHELTKPVIAFAVIRAVAITITVAIALGLDLAYADWMPLAALVAMKPSLEQTTLVGEQRLVGAFLGAIVASALLLTIENQDALQLIMLVIFGLGTSIRTVNYALYNAAIAAGVLIALGLPDPSNLSAEGKRVLFTFIGVAIGVLVMLLAGLLAKRRQQITPELT
jgi:hypothetical protein